MKIEVGNIVRLKEIFSFNKNGDKEWINVSDRLPLKVISTGNFEGFTEYCKVSGNGFNLKTKCSNLILIKEKGEIPTTII